jgi:hypothetical protein
MDHHSSGQFGCNLAACRTCPGADATHTSGHAKRAQIETMPVKRGDPVPSRYQFRLGDGEVDLSEAFSLGGSYGVGSAWKMPSAGKFQERFGRWKMAPPKGDARVVTAYPLRVRRL